MRVSNDLAERGCAKKRLCVVTLQWRLRRDFMLRRWFRLAYLLRSCSDFPNLVLGVGKCCVVVVIIKYTLWL